VDSLTHGFSIALILRATGMSGLLFWGIAGAVSLDIDVIFSLFSDPYPSLFILSHGGFTHSLIGAILVSVIMFLLIRRALACPAVRKTLLLHVPDLENYISGPVPAGAVLVVIAGAWLHLALDCAAPPGLPLLYPLSSTAILSEWCHG
jgi:Predicted membrane-bound metal-dependent hydrolase (DUF457).